MSKSCTILKFKGG